MAKRKAKLSAGDRVTIRPETRMPEFDSLAIGGWSGVILELQGRGATQKIILEWDEASRQHMPDEYRAHCEEQGLFYGYACIPLSDIAQTDD